jgi:hypothetical protein
LQTGAWVKGCALQVVGKMLWGTRGGLEDEILGWPLGRRQHLGRLASPQRSATLRSIADGSFRGAVSTLKQVRYTVQ